MITEQMVNIYDELQLLVEEIKREEQMPTLDTFVYGKRHLHEDGVVEPRYEISVMIKRFF